MRGERQKDVTEAYRRGHDRIWKRSLRRFRCYGQRGMDSYGPSVEVEAFDEDDALRQAMPKLKAFADCYIAEEIFGR